MFRKYNSNQNKISKQDYYSEKIFQHGKVQGYEQ